MVVREERLLHVVRRARGFEVSRRTEDGVVIVVDVAAVAVLSPRRRDELHGSLSAGTRQPANAAHAALDQMDRREVIPGHGEFGLGFLVVAEELIDRLRLDDLPVWKVLRNRAVQQAQLFAGLEARVHGGTRLLRERSEDGVLPLGVVLKPAVGELL